jgi:flagellar basal-body rod protein FlgB
MAFSTSSMFGIHEHALSVRTKRAEILASNIANADTPGYKAQDLDFKTALRNAQESMSSGANIERTNQKHFGLSDLDPQAAIRFRQNYQPDTGDGNTVDINIERMAYMQNSLEFQTSVEFLNGKINGLRKVIAGE